MKYCRNCGNEVDRKARFCTKCGEDLRNNHNQTHEFSTFQKALIIVLISLVVGIFLELSGYGSQTAEPIEEPTEFSAPAESESTESSESVEEEAELAEEADIEETEEELADIDEEEISLMFLEVIKENYNGVAEVSLDQEQDLYIFIPLDDELVSKLSSGDAQAIASWDTVVETMVELSEAIKVSLPGYKLALLNPLNTENVLLLINDGYVMYDFIND